MNNVNLKDKSKEILEKINEIKDCLDELIEEIAPYTQNDMPELKSGMFGIAKHLKTDKINAFYVTEDTIIYEDGDWDSHSIFDNTGKSGYTQILALYDSDTKSFKRVKKYYYDIDNPNPSELIWKKID